MYDPVMCMNIPDSVKTKDAMFNVVYKTDFGTMQALLKADNEKDAENKVRAKEGNKFKSLIGVKKMGDSVETKDADYKMEVTTYVINEGQSGQYYGLKNKKNNQVLYSAPNNWKTKAGAKKWAESHGFVFVEDSKTIDKAIRNCDDLNSDKQKALEEYKKAKKGV